MRPLNPVCHSKLACRSLLNESGQGEVGVSYFPRPSREIVPEAQLDLVDRNYQPGDLLKRSVDDVVSGVVTGYVLVFLRALAALHHAH